MFTNETVAMSRANVESGMVVQSSHGYRILVTELWDGAESRVPNRNVVITGHLHADSTQALVHEHYPANSTVPVEIESLDDGDEMAGSIRADHLVGLRAALHTTLDQHGVDDNDALVDALYDTFMAGSEA